jgi:putative aminopeptidase FrvX
MKTIKNNLIKTLNVQTTSYNTKNMIKFIFKEVSEIPNCSIELNQDNIYITKGENTKKYPCVIAHTDTVHDIVDNFKIYSSNNSLFSINQNTLERVGIGGDDKVGVFIALELLKFEKNIKIVFFADEEVGCIGSSLAKMNFFDDVGFILQCDRQGYGDFINQISNVNLYSKQFSQKIKPLLKKYNFKETNGGMTDVYQLKLNGLNISVANMSCGYYDPHTENEFVHIPHVYFTLQLCKEIINLCKNKKWEHKEKLENIYTQNQQEQYCKTCFSDNIFFDQMIDEHFCVDCAAYLKVNNLI